MFSLALVLLSAAPVAAQQTGRPAEEADDAICADRPGIASSTCIVGPGRVQAELAIDWSFQEEAGDRSDVLTVGDSVVRIGLDARTEMQIGWTAFGRVRERSGGLVARSQSIGDAFVGARRMLYDKDGVSVALQGRLSLPVGGAAIGAGTWGADVIVPIGFAAGETEFFIGPNLSAAPDADGRGRHLAYGVATGAGFTLAPRLSAVLDLALYRDEDPLGASTELLGGVALAYQASRNFQLDAGAVVGLNRDAGDLGLYVGAARRF